MVVIQYIGDVQHYYLLFNASFSSCIPIAYNQNVIIP